MLTKNDVIQKATELFEGNESAALNWFNEPNRALQRDNGFRRGGVDGCHAHFAYRTWCLLLICLS